VHYIVYIKSDTSCHSYAFRQPLMPSSGGSVLLFFFLTHPNGDPFGCVRKKQQ